MTKSFLNILLPNDEYKREKMLYFLAESAVVTMILSLTVAIVDYVLLNWIYESIIPLFLIPVFMMMYTFFRYIFSGMEYTEVVDEADYKKQCQRKGIQSIFSGVMFSILYTAMSGFPASANGWYKVIGMSILFTAFLFLIYYVSLKRSYKKNKELED